MQRQRLLGRVLERASRYVSCRDDLGAGREDLSDEQWAALERLLPVAQIGRPSVCRRRLSDGSRRRVRTSAPWRDQPVEHGLWQTVCGLFR
ncbi:transposase [Streptomyces sp. NPDC001401]|uniref:transposase n=1 Tax=Streptomyces sp. NPDC001401 TaxID=3364570 RepID=UPI0036CE5DA2